jgi:hypothetical protein
MGGAMRQAQLAGSRRQQGYPSLRRRRDAPPLAGRSR